MPIGSLLHYRYIIVYIYCIYSIANIVYNNISLIIITCWWWSRWWLTQAKVVTFKFEFYFQSQTWKMPPTKDESAIAHLPYTICHVSGSCSGDIDDDRQPKQTHTDKLKQVELSQPTQLYKYYTSIRNASSITKDISSRHSELGAIQTGDLQCVL